MRGDADRPSPLIAQWLRRLDPRPALLLLGVVLRLRRRRRAWATGPGRTQRGSREVVKPTLAKRSLMEQHPTKHLVPTALLISTTLLLIGLSLPLLQAHQQVLWKKWQNSYSVWAGCVALWEQSEYTLAAVLFFFSIVFPLVKLVALAIIWYVKLAEQQRTTILHWLGLLGKWSMLDVFIVAILIVLVKLGPLAHVEPRAGVYFFAAAIAASMLTTMYVTRLACRPLRSI